MAAVHFALPVLIPALYRLVPCFARESIAHSALMQ
jgi:hypothetical protein